MKKLKSSSSWKERKRLIGSILGRFYHSLRSFQNDKRRHAGALAIASIFVVVGIFVFLHLQKPAQAVPWPSHFSEWAKRKQVTLVNNSGQTLNQNTTYQINLDTSNQKEFMQSCDDLRVIYQPNSTTATELSRNVTNCNSQSSIVYFPLQSSIANGLSSSDYYVYYANSHAPSVTSVTSLQSYDTTPGGASFVAPFNGTTQAIASGSGAPTTATGAIRYSGAKTALVFDGTGDQVALTSAANSVKTVELWIYPNATTTPLFDLGGGITATVSAGTVTLAGFTSPTTYINGVATSTITANAWSHLAITTNTAFNTSSAIFGQVKGSYFNGKIDEIRLSDTVRYSAAFTPQTSPFVRDSNTKLLLHFDENGDDPRNSGKAIDDSGNANHGTITGAKYVGGLIGVDDSNLSNLTNLTNINSQSFASHQGVFIEEGTTNKITNPSFENSTFSTNWSTSSGVLNYDSSSDTFTPSVAKRSGAGPFAAGVMVQGKDVLSASYGTQLNGNFYTNFDTTQGSVALWWTPEYATGTDKKYLWYVNANYYLAYDYTNTRFEQVLGGQTQTVSSSLTAGTTVGLVTRWDAQNVIQGANYADLSINDSQNFGITTQPTVSAPAATIYVGTDGTTASDGIIQGLTVYRRVLYDGTNGINANAGADEVSKIKTTGGTDPTLTTGSWDVVFALPTNSTTGALTTGTGNAWSHPHASNLLYTSTTNTGGFMMNGTYTTDGWVDEGTPTAVAALATGSKVFAGGYAVTSDAANEGISYTKALTANANYVIRALGNSDGTCNPQILVTRADGTTEITHLNGTTTSTRAAPDVYIFTFQAPATENGIFKLINTAATGTCSWHQVEVQSNLVVNPSFEGSPASPYIPTGWTGYNSPGSSDLSQETTIIHSGTSSLKFNSTAFNRGINQTPSTNTFIDSGVFVNVTSGTLGVTSTTSYHQRNTTALNESVTTSGWKLYPYVLRQTSSFRDIFTAYSTGPVAYVDDCYAVNLSDVSLTVTPASEANSGETSGLRVDGADTLTQTISNLASKSGEIAFNWTPRHSAGVWNKFGIAYPVLFDTNSVSGQEIMVYTDISSVVLSINDSTGNVSNSWNATGNMTAGNTYLIKVKYSSGSAPTLEVNGTTRITLSRAVTFTVGFPTAYFGSSNAGGQQSDGTFALATGLNGPIYVNTTAPYYKFGSQSTQVNAQDATVYATSITPTAASHTLSAYVYYTGATIDGSVAALWWEGRVVNTVYTDMGGGWWRLTYSAATTNSANNYGVYVASGKTVYVDGVQLEEKAYATTYADGTLGTGYAWTGTANNSTSTRTVATLQYSATNNIAAAAGTISVWAWLPGYQSCTANSSVGIIDTNISGGSCEIHIGTDCGVSALEIRGVAGAGCSGGGTVSTTLPSVGQGKWHHYVGTWNGSTLTYYIDGVSVGTPASYTTAPTMSHIRMFSGLNNDSLTGAASDLRIFDRALSSGQVSQLYYASLASHSEGGPVKRFSQPEDPIAYWKLDEGTGTTAQDAGVNNYDLTLNSPVNLPTWQTEDLCVAGKCLYFEGSNATASAAVTLAGVQSLSFWAKPASSSGTIPMLSLSSGTGDISVTSSNLTLSAPGLTSPTYYVNGKVGTTLTANTWNHIEITTATSFSATNPVLGKIQTTYFKGFLDEIKFYNYARTAAQVKADYDGAAKRGASSWSGAIGSSSPLNNGLVGYWRMDESSWNGTAGEVLNASGNSNNGTAACTGGGCTKPTTGAGKFGNGGSFDGSEDYVNTNATNLVSGTSGITMSGWIKFTSSSGYGVVVGSQGSLGLVLSTSNFKWVIWDSDWSFSQTFTPGTWYHVVATYDRTANKRYAYVNGSQINSTATTVNLATQSTAWTIGNWLSQNELFNGSLDELRIYNRALTPAEVRQLYNFAPGPVGYWKFDDPAPGGAGQVIDSSGNGNTGTWYGSGVAGHRLVTGKFGKAGGFNNSDDKVTVSSNAVFRPKYALTAEAWVKSNSLANADCVLNVGNPENSPNNGYYIRWNNGSFQTLIGTGSTYANATTPFSSNNIWVHVAGVFNGNSVTTYINGIPGTPASYTGQISYADTETFLIGLGNANCLAWNGSIDDVKIYNYARTADQIMEDMLGRTDAGVSLQGVTASGKGTRINLKMDEGYGTTTKDSATGGVTGTLNDGAAWSQSGKYNKGIILDGTNDDVSVADFSY